MSDSFTVAGGFILPHPPIIVPDVNKAEIMARKTIDAMNAVGAEIAGIKPETVIIISPHAPLFSDYIFMYDSPSLEGDLSKFGARSVKLSMRQDTELLRLIEGKFRDLSIPGGTLSDNEMRSHSISPELDHGVMVPLYFLTRKYDGFSLIAMSCSGLQVPQLYKAGELIAEAAAALGRRIVIVASGDMSHKVNEESPYHSCPEGAEFDKLFVDSVASGDLAKLLSIDGELREKAAECGYKSAVILCGAFNGKPVKTEVYAYEAPYGIGYCVASIKIGENAGGQPVKSAMEAALEKRREAAFKNAVANSPHVRIAKETLENYVQSGNVKNVSDFADIESKNICLFKNRAGVFVSLKKFGELRGCIGTTGPTTQSIAAEIIQNAISAGTRDPRFDAVEPDELEFIDYSVDVLEKSEPAPDKSTLDPKIYGVIVRKGARSGLLLPDLEGVDTVDYQLEIACRKAGIDSMDDYAIERFKVTRYK